MWGFSPDSRFGHGARISGGEGMNNYHHLLQQQRNNPGIMERIRCGVLGEILGGEGGNSKIGRAEQARQRRLATNIRDAEKTNVGRTWKHCGGSDERWSDIDQRDPLW